MHFLDVFESIVKSSNVLVATIISICVFYLTCRDRKEKIDEKSRQIKGGETSRDDEIKSVSSPVDDESKVDDAAPQGAGTCAVSLPKSERRIEFKLITTFLRLKFSFIYSVVCFVLIVTAANIDIKREVSKVEARHQNSLSEIAKANDSAKVEIERAVVAYNAATEAFKIAKNALDVQGRTNEKLLVGMEDIKTQIKVVPKRNFENNDNDVGAPASFLPRLIDKLPRQVSKELSQANSPPLPIDKPTVPVSIPGDPNTPYPILNTEDTDNRRLPSYFNISSLQSGSVEKTASDPSHTPPQLLPPSRIPNPDERVGADYVQGKPIHTYRNLSGQYCDVENINTILQIFLENVVDQPESADKLNEQQLRELVANLNEIIKQKESKNENENNMLNDREGMLNLR